MKLGLGNGLTMSASAVGNPYIQTINFVGDSITDVHNVNTASWNKANRNISFSQWFMALQKGMNYAQYNPTGNSSGFGNLGTYEFATFGATTATIQTNHLTEINNNRGDLVCLLVGANNLGNINQTSAQTFAEIQTFVTALNAASHNNLLICALTPRASANNSLGSDGKTFAVRVQETNALLAAWCPTVGVKFCDWTSAITDGSGFWLSGYSYDNIHPSIKGSQVMGDYLKTFIAANYRQPDSIYDLTWQGTLNSGSDATSGFSFFTDTGGGGAASASGSTVAASDGLGSWRRLTTSHATPASNYTEWSKTGITLPGAWGIVNGDLIQPVLEARLLSATTFGVEARITANGNTSLMLSPSSTYTQLWQPFEGLFLGQPFAVQAASTVTAFMNIKGSVALDVRRFGFRKVTSMVPPYI